MTVNFRDWALEASAGPRAARRRRASAAAAASKQLAVIAMTRTRPEGGSAARWQWASHGALNATKCPPEAQADDRCSSEQLCASTTLRLAVHDRTETCAALIIFLA